MMVKGDKKMLNSYSSKTAAISLEDFQKMIQIDIQRNIEHRIPKITKHLTTNPLPNHLHVASVTYPDPNNSEIILKRSIDGHGRKASWAKLEADGIEVPEVLLETEYKASSYEEAKKIYYAIDSQDSVETAGDKFTGVCSKLGLDFNTSKLQKGGIGKAVQYGAKGTKALNGHTKINNDNRENVVELFSDALEHIDKMDIGSKNKRFSHQAMWAACLMIITKFGFSNRVKEGIYRLINGNTNSSNVDPKIADAMTHINVEWSKPRDEGVLANCRGLTDAVSLPLQLDYLLFHWDRWLDNSDDYNKNKWKSQQKHTNSKYRGNYYYNSFWIGTPYSTKK